VTSFVQDAEKALTYGVDGIIVSNHGKEIKCAETLGQCKLIISACLLNVRWSTSRWSYFGIVGIGNDYEVIDN
jgi:isopentenyl diphosphate isomerase/L-lactate dehydrogenase-like FMN-dependent dehydrogenase